MMLLRTICTITTALAMTLALTSCGAEDSSEEDSAAKNSAVSVGDSESGKSAEDILSKISDDKLDASAYLGGQLDKYCKQLYGIEADVLSDGGIIYSSEGSADEISMLKFKDNSSAENLYKARLESRKTQFDNYKPEESSKIENALVYKQGDYWVLIISDHADKLKSTIAENG